MVEIMYPLLIYIQKEIVIEEIGNVEHIIAKRSLKDPL
jgi:hypothetical protein